MPDGITQFTIRQSPVAVPEPSTWVLGRWDDWVLACFAGAAPAKPRSTRAHVPSASSGRGTNEPCRNWYHRQLPGGTDPDLHAAQDTATKSDHGEISRSRRGGCWADEGWPCRSAFRLRFEPERRYDPIGFRVVAVRL